MIRAFSILLLTLFLRVAAEEHPVTFYLHPDLVQDPATVQRRLQGYVADVNRVLALNTHRVWRYAGLIVTDQQPYTGYAWDLPGHDFPIWVVARKIAGTVSQGGSQSVDVAGAGVVCCMGWTAVHEPAAGGQDYDWQIHVMLHEFAHVFGAGISEYYTTARVMDDTGVEPLRNVDSSDPLDPYWSAHADRLTDPLLRFNRLVSARYSPLTAAIVNGSSRSLRDLPPLADLVVTVTNLQGRPVPGARVRVWRRGGPDLVDAPMGDQVTGPDGTVRVDWLLPWSNSTNFRTIKAHKDSAGAVAHVSVFDLQEAVILRGARQLIVPLVLDVPVPRTLTLQSSVDMATWRDIGIIQDSEPGDRRFYRLRIE